jgi:transcriptional regulator with XRE-family HTH domain
MIYEFGKRIIKARKAKGLDAKELADIIDVMPTRLNNWERGLNRPMAEHIALIAKALDVSPDYLLCMTDDMHLRSGGSTATIGIGAFGGGQPLLPE